MARHSGTRVLTKGTRKSVAVKATPRLRLTDLANQIHRVQRIQQIQGCSGRDDGLSAGLAIRLTAATTVVAVVVLTPKRGKVESEVGRR
mmetsp:Transcript_54086/g.149228  ORF Transcript_54086/g.149228 Transcript_54086/m.149228 type:complete len:89 (+) Transcript_54086:796-1062(+)